MVNGGLPDIYYIDMDVLLTNSRDEVYSVDSRIV